MEVFEIPQELTGLLKQQSLQSGTTLYITLLAAFKALLYRYTGAEDMVIGGVTDLRRRPELQSVVGYFLNTFAIRSRPSGARSFDHFRREVRDSLLGALDVSEVPFDEVIAVLNIRRDRRPHPLFNILFSIEPPMEPFPPGWDLTQMDISVGTAKFDLYLELDERPDGMVGRFMYSTESFDRATIQRMVRNWLVLLHEVAAKPDEPLCALNILTPEDKFQLLGEWNAEPLAVRHPLLMDLISTQISRNPEKLAIIFREIRWSYAELGTQIDRIAQGLLAAKVTKGTLVAVGLERGIDMVAALLAILKIGAAYLPLDVDFPTARLGQILDAAKPDAVLVHRSTAGSVSQSSAPQVIIEDLVALDHSVTAVAVAADDRAYVIFTSGSTGTPKGVEVTHGALSNLLISMRDKPGFSERDVLLAVTTIAFDIAALELFLPLIAGGKLVISPSEVASNPLLLGPLIDATSATVVQATPATWRGLMDAGWQGQLRLVALCGGETMSTDLASALTQRVGRLWNMYGPTETTIWSLIADVTDEHGVIPVGWPIRNTVSHILDKDQNLVPIGVIGELHIGGAGLARGYHNLPERTADLFVTPPSVGGERLYPTGDLAYRRQDGAVMCLGRMDGQEKIRGFRVAVEEVEDALMRHPDIAAAVVRSWPDSLGGRTLAAYLVTRSGTGPSPSQLRSHLRHCLPDYMIPSSFETLSTIPMTPNGKLDRNALPKPAQQFRADVFVEPQGDLETRLAAIWQEVLGIETVSRDDSFADLGGHSLLVARLLQRVHQNFGISVGMAEFFCNDRLADMAQLLTGFETGKRRDFIPIQPVGNHPPILWLAAGADFVALSEALTVDQPLLGVPILSILDGHPDDMNDFRCLARHVTDEIMLIRPDGPYILGGYCTFGILAYEVAQQLKSAGRDVRLLILVHAINPEQYLKINRLMLVLSRVRYKLAQVMTERAIRPSIVLNLVKKATALAVLPSARLRQVNTHPTAAALERAAYTYCPGPYDGDVLALQPLDRVAILDASASWTGAVAGILTRFDIPGAHLTIFKRPFVVKMGQLISAHLAGQRSNPPRGKYD